MAKISKIPTRLEQMCCWPMVLERLRSGEPIKEVVEFIQKKQYEYTDVSPESLRVSIHRWLKRNPKAVHRKKDFSIPKHFIDSVNARHEPTPQEKMNILFAVQFDRFYRDYMKEVEQGVTFSWQNEIVRDLVNIIVETHKCDVRERKVFYQGLRANRKSNIRPSRIGLMERLPRNTITPEVVDDFQQMLGRLREQSRQQRAEEQRKAYEASLCPNATKTEPSVAQNSDKVAL